MQVSFVYVRAKVSLVKSHIYLCKSVIYISAKVPYLLVQNSHADLCKSRVEKSAPYSIYYNLFFDAYLWDLLSTEQQENEQSNFRQAARRQRHSKTKVEIPIITTISSAL